MPERPFIVAAYAAGAGLAAATLVYVFGPTFLLDESANSKSAKGRHAVGLSNPANDCFINSVLQALAGSSQLRVYLIRESHLRKLLKAGDPSAHQHRSNQKDDNQERDHTSLIAGPITTALREMLNALNERPISKKTISAQSLITAVERAFNTRVSRYQQDAQEFLQILLERLADEHKAFHQLLDRKPQNDAVAYHRQGVIEQRTTSTSDARISVSKLENLQSEEQKDLTNEKMLGSDIHTANDTMPFEGSTESQIECTVCHFMPKPSRSDFVTLSLNVPNATGSTTLDTCFDGTFKLEYVDGFRCDRCRLTHALQTGTTKLKTIGISDGERHSLQQYCSAVERAIETDPENPPPDLQLPSITSSPTSRIKKHMRISTYPKVLSIHLSRSVWNVHASSSKNMAKVSFQEVLTLGPLFDRKTYQLFAVVTHKGGHNSGHYETFRRQRAQTPYSTPMNMATRGTYPQNETPTQSPSIRAMGPTDAAEEAGTDVMDQPAATAEHEALQERQHRTSEFKDSQRTARQSAPSVTPTSEKRSASLMNPAKSKGRVQDRWWRLNDDKVKDCKISDVLAMHREVYLLFYEMQE